jgi:hypothetical protein
LQEREVMKLGSRGATPIDVRVIAATHRDLHALVEEGVLRADLYFRLNLFCKSSCRHCASGAAIYRNWRGICSGAAQRNTGCPPRTRSACWNS